MTKIFWHIYHTRTNGPAGAAAPDATVAPPVNNNNTPPGFQHARGVAPRFCKSRTIWNHRWILSSSKLTVVPPNLPAREPRARIVKVSKEEYVPDSSRVPIQPPQPEPVGRKTAASAPMNLTQQFHYMKVFAEQRIPKPTYVQVPRPMTYEVTEKIKDHVLRGLQNWDSSKDTKHAKSTFPLRQDHKLLGLLLDGLYKHYFKGSFAVAVVPNDAILRALCKEVLANVPDEYKEKAKEVMDSFEPNARETMQILYEKWEKLPVLQDLAPENRWRTLVDPIKIEMLAEQGINPDNPMLAFLFESGIRRERALAHKGANAWVTWAENLNTPFSPDLVRKLHEANNGVGYTGEDRLHSFSAKLTSKGIRTFILHMYRLYQRGIESRLDFDIPDNVVGYSFTKHRGLLRNHSDKWGEYEKSMNDADQMATNMQNVAKKSLTPEAVQIDFLRGDMLHTTSDAIIAEIVANYNKEAAQATSSDEKVLASGSMCLEGDHVHLYSYGNLRTWAKYVFNLSLFQQKEKIAILRDPLKWEGMHPDEHLAATREGQQLWASWLKPELRNQQAGGTSSA